ncbi:MAG TPA: recombination protein RecR [Candidatus Portnoybacteria bacterium]|nr:recombination protein RecR [Candidatus Portnoybacteria bacterium]
MLPQSIQNLTDELSKLPGIGPRAAARLAFYLLYQSPEEVTKLISAIQELKQKTKICRQCFNLTEEELCLICKNPKRDSDQICVVEEALDISPLEQTGRYNGLYHVLGGTLSPLEGRGPDNLRIKELVNRIKKNQLPIKEIIIATNPNTEGETTALYLVRILKPLNIKITRLGRGLATGGSLEYADETTLSSALNGRREYK